MSYDPTQKEEHWTAVCCMQLKTEKKERTYRYQKPEIQTKLFTWAPLGQCLSEICDREFEKDLYLV
jgi:hypothetical protein